MKYKFKVGDIVRAISNNYVYTNIVNDFVGEVVKVYKHSMTVKVIDIKNYKILIGKKYDVNQNDFELVERPESIHVYRKGQEVHAIKKIGKEVVEHTVAKCSPEDTFDFGEGAMIALDRLFFDHLKKPKLYNAKLVCVDDENGFCDFKVGKIYNVVDGFLYLNNDEKYGRDSMDVEPFTDLEEINEKMAPTFIELVED